MSSLSTSTTTEQTMLLQPIDLAAWSAETFAQNVRLARRPLPLIGGFGQQRITLVGSNPAKVATEVTVPVIVGHHRIDAHLNVDHLDQLLMVLDPDAKPGDGRTLSLDAIEAILAGLLAPLDGVRVDHASAEQDEIRPVLGLHLGDACLPVTGRQTACEVLEAAFSASVDHHVAAPLSYLKDTSLQSLTVNVEHVVGLVSLDPEQRLALKPGGGVVLDAVWPEGRSVVGRRFVHHGSQWKTDPSFANGALRVRAAHETKPLSADDLDEDLDSGPLLELVDGETTVATGYLASLKRGNQPPRLILALDPLDW